MCCTDGERITPFTTLVAPDRIRSIVTKNVKRLMSGSVTLLTDQYMLPTRVDGDTVYTHADQAPRFDFSGESLMNYLAHNLRLDPVAIERLPAGARAVIAFIVDASGHIRRPCVVSSATPGIDRELMRAARLMPAWAPGTVGGKPANNTGRDNLLNKNVTKRIIQTSSSGGRSGGGGGGHISSGGAHHGGGGHRH